MDERALKRLLIMAAISIVVIMLFKSIMTRNIVNLNKAAVEKKQAAVVSSPAQQEVTPIADAEIAVEEPDDSAVEATPLEQPVASAVGDGSAE